MKKASPGPWQRAARRGHAQVPAAAYRPEPAWGWLAHLALVPGAVLAIRSTRAKRLAWSTYVVSLVWWFTMIHWIAPVTVGGYVALSVYLALYTPAALLTVRLRTTLKL